MRLNPRLNGFSGRKLQPKLQPKLIQAFCGPSYERLDIQRLRVIVGDAETLEKQWWPHWGTGGREFKSRRSEQFSAAFSRIVRATTSRCHSPSAERISSKLQTSGTKTPEKVPNYLRRYAPRCSCDVRAARLPPKTETFRRRTGLARRRLTGTTPEKSAPSIFARAP